MLSSLALAPTSATAQQVRPGGSGSRHLAAQVAVLPIVNEDGFRPGPELTLRAGYAVDVLILEVLAGFQSFAQQVGSSSLGVSQRESIFGPFIGVGGRLRFPAGETFAPYFSGAIRLSWWKRADTGLRFTPTLCAQLGTEIALGTQSRYLVHLGVESQVHLPGKAFSGRLWTVGPFIGVGFIYG